MLAWSTSEGAKSERIPGDLNSISSAIKSYRNLAGELPPPGLGLQALITRPASLPAGKPWRQSLFSIPLDPWSRPYRYVAGEGLKDGFGLYSCGPDGVSKTAGNDPDDLNTWSDRDEKSWTLWIALGGMAVAAGSFYFGVWMGRTERREAG
ncbi:type II secretion system protein GspG [Luteolibacter sp. Populi]|uniref:type II secretion system protein GspG n=1 Tax=Luteolibacter sp. Populi TaxID=3230487 RepID=UPI003465797C